MKTYLYHVTGMHCPSCPMLVEGELGDMPEVATVKASLKKHSVEIAGDFGTRTPEQIAADLNAVLAAHGYALSSEKQRHHVAWSDFSIAIPIAAAFILLFITLQKLGIVNLVTSSKMNYGTAFIIGLIASVSSCMAVVGGLVLSLSANFAKEGEHIRPQVLFHVGRIVSFLVLGGVIGMIGSVFVLGGTGTFILSFIVALVLLILGINLLDIFPGMKKLQLALPGGVGTRVHSLKTMNHTLMPFLIGTATFFLPCGFTQSMQLYALSTGSFWTGGLTMLAFALGTLPVLSMLSFSSLAIHKKAQSGIFFKTAGIIVIFFGIFNLINSLVAAGIIHPL